MRRGPLRKTDNRNIHKLAEAHRLLGQMSEGRSADRDFLNLADLLLDERIRNNRAFRHDREIGKAVLHSGKSLRR